MGCNGSRTSMHSWDACFQRTKGDTSPAQGQECVHMAGPCSNVPQRKLFQNVSSVLSSCDHGWNMANGWRFCSIERAVSTGLVRLGNDSLEGIQSWWNPKNRNGTVLARAKGSLNLESRNRHLLSAEGGLAHRAFLSLQWWLPPVPPIWMPVFRFSSSHAWPVEAIQQTQRNLVASPVHGSCTTIAKWSQAVLIRQQLMEVGLSKQANQRIFPRSHCMPHKRVIHATSPELSKQCRVHVADIAAIPQWKGQNGLPHLVKRAAMAWANGDLCSVDGRIRTKISYVSPLLVNFCRTRRVPVLLGPLKEMSRRHGTTIESWIVESWGIGFRAENLGIKSAWAARAWIFWIKAEAFSEESGFRAVAFRVFSLVSYWR